MPGEGVKGTGLLRGAPVLPLVGACHPGPSVAVTAAVALLAVGQHLPLPRGALVTAAVLCGQLTIGWGNDLLDRDRDRITRRTDKPLAADEVGRSLVLFCLGIAGVACVALSFAVGWRSAAVHLGTGVLSGHLYNLGLKGTAWSWAPYAVAFGTLPAVVTLADLPPRWPPGLLLVAAVALGVGAHLLNALPDLADDVATGIRGLPHRIGAGPSRVLAVVLLVLASVSALSYCGLGAARWLALAVVGVLAVLALTTRGRAPFAAAVAIALVDVALLAVAGS